MCIILGIIIALILVIIIGVGSIFFSAIGVLFSFIAAIFLTPYFWIALIVLIILGFISENSWSCLGCFIFTFLVLSIMIYFFFKFLLSIS
ncbi:hypothetical protein STFE110948_06010 [Streptobacillus felis]|uniref:Uncharacterized protein n=1 Tax=Streptobacillus felis TaxID=1384509 RepID=A0A7Z0PHY1_9FUSO|nr:hypothetical protein [Streptobacillus felis]NYV28315.1 hypothetical protein [Streptobacillus felis]